MRFVNDNEREIMEERGELLVVWQDGNVQHIRVGEENGGRALDLGPKSGRGIAIVTKRSTRQV